MNIRRQVHEARAPEGRAGIDSGARARLQRERVVDAATAVYGEAGYNDARVEQIAARAGVSKRTLYEHFRDLAGLRQAVYERALQGTLLRVATLARSTSVSWLAAADPLRSVLLELFRSVKENRHLGQIISYELRQSDPTSVALRQQIVAFFIGVFHDGWTRDFRRGVVPHPPNEVIIRAIVGGAEALAVWIIESDPPVTPDEAADGLVSLLRAWCPRQRVGPQRERA